MAKIAMKIAHLMKDHHYTHQSVLKNWILSILWNKLEY